MNEVTISFSDIHSYNAFVVWLESGKLNEDFTKFRNDNDINIGRTEINEAPIKQKTKFLITLNHGKSRNKS